MHLLGERYCWFTSHMLQWPLPALQASHSPHHLLLCPHPRPGPAAAAAKKKRAKRNLALLSFGTEAEAEEQELAAVAEGAKIRSAHDVLEDDRSGLMPGCGPACHAAALDLRGASSLKHQGLTGSQAGQAVVEQMVTCCTLPNGHHNIRLCCDAQATWSSASARGKCTCCTCTHAEVSATSALCRPLCLSRGVRQRGQQ